MDTLRAGERDSAARAEILAFQSAELTAAGVKKGEEDALLEERSRLVNAEKIALLANTAYDALTGSAAASELSASAADALEKLAAYLPAVQPLAERVKSAMYELEDVAESLRDYREAEEPARGSTGSSSACPTSRGCAKNTAPTPTACPRCWRKSTARSRRSNILTSTSPPPSRRRQNPSPRCARTPRALTETRVKAAAAFEKAVQAGAGRAGYAEGDVPHRPYAVGAGRFRRG